VSGVASSAAITLYYQPLISCAGTVGQVGNLRTDCLSVQPGAARPWSFYIFPL